MSLAFTSAPAPAVPAPLRRSSSATALSRIIECLRRARERARQRRAMADLSDHLLRDIGITRWDTEAL